MSTVRTNNILDASGGNTATINSMTPTADSLQGFRNRIMNGGFNIAQRGTSFVSGANDDDTYNLDRWYILSDGNDAVDITQTTTVPTGAKYSIGLDVETANKKFGIAQIIENVNCFDAIGQTVTLSFDAKVSSTTKLDNVKCAIVAWSGTADSVTSDIISAWGAEGTNPTLIANATYENSPANLNVTTSFARYTVSAAVDTSSTTNIIVFIWSDVTDTTAGDFLYITNTQLEVGSVATPFERRDYGRELIMCQRYYQLGLRPMGYAYNTTTIQLGIQYVVPMRAAPTYGLTGALSITDGVGSFTQSSASAGSFNSVSTIGGFVSGAGNFSGMTSRYSCITTNDVIYVSAEL